MIFIKNIKHLFEYLLLGVEKGREESMNEESIHDHHSTNPTNPNKTAKPMPTAKCISPLTTTLIPDEVPFEPDVEEPVDDDVAPDAVPDAEVDVLELEVEKVTTGSAETVLQVPPLDVVFGS